jgi:hypothetical protein
MEWHKGQFWDLFLFLLYMNELPLNIQNTKMVLFADYTNILVHKDVDAFQQKLNRVLKQICCENNNLLINTKKTMSVILQFNKIRPVIMPCIVFNTQKLLIYQN